MLVDLGFTYRDGLRDAFPNDFGGQLSDERTDVGALLWFTAEGDVERSITCQAKPVDRGLEVRKAGWDVFIRPTDRVCEAASVPSVSSMPLLMRELVPRLAAAADGDPDTSTDQT